MKFPVRIFIILLCTCMSARSAHAQESSDLKGTSCIPVRSVAGDELAFQDGESMHFAVQYKWGAVNTDVGYATVRLDTLCYNGVEAFRCSAYGYTKRFFDFFFKVREDFKSWFTYDGMRPLKFTRDTQEGSYKARNTYIYDWTLPEPHIVADVYSTSSGQRNIDLPLTPCTFDLPSLFFYARNMNFDIIEPGKKYPMTFAIDDDIFNVYFILYGRETIKVKGLGTVKTIRFGAKLLEGEVFKGDEDMMIWVSDDENRLPVYFEAPLLVGLATGRLLDVEGTKHPFTALVEDKRN
ncbi:MAG: DUF3108 domain-containing protein [Bacteroidales bacterium]|nr:DUF3108 domain-containing protein [Bacteroidales bacterium]